jgi:hypothetical protein
VDKTESRSFTPPWMLLAVLAMGGAAYYGKRPVIDTDRPHSAPLPGGGVQSPPAVPAHRWEDPLQASIQDWTRPGTEDAPPKAVEPTQVGIRKTLQQAKGCLILPVFIDSGSFPESEEARLRTRYAVLSALGFGRYQPADGDILRYFVVKTAVLDLQEAEREIVVPYELFTSPDPRKPDEGAESVLVLWLGEGFLGRKPIATILAILRALPDDGREVHLIGPTGSQMLETITGEAALLPPDALSRWILYSDRATVNDYDGTASTSKFRLAIQQQMVQGYSPKAPMPAPDAKPGEAPLPLRIERTIGRDGLLALELMRELKYRDAFPGHPDRRTVILSEWDSLYARNWREALRAAVNKVIEESGGTKPAADAPLPPNVYSYTYLRGVDGKGAPADGKKPNDLPEGFAQIDYVRRIDAQLTALQAEVGRITAIGVMGSDLYDKIVLLKALRKTFPEAIFFTSDLDARFLHADEWDWAHNLVIGSHFGLSLRRELQPSVPPFRDCYQTSTYLAALKATGMKHPLLEKGPPKPLVFEVGRDRASPLISPEPDSVHPPVGRGGHFLAPLFSFVSFLVALLAVLLFLLRHSIRHDAAPASYDRTLWKSFVLSAALLLALTLAIVHDSLREGGGEPFSITGGISVWPTELVRFLVIGLCLASCRLLPRALEDNRVRLEAEFPALKQEQGGAAAAWRRYLAASNGRAWVRRLACWAAPYLFAAAVLIARESFPRRPIRGQVANLVDWCFSGFGLLLMNFVLWGVADAMLMCRRWVAELLREGFDWPESDRRAAVSSDAALTASADQMISLRLIAARTEPVGRLVFYPFLLLSLLVLARTEIFDAWSWNLPLALFFSSMAAVCLAMVLLLRRTAERARASALEQVQRDRLTATTDAVRSSLEEIERQIASLRRGAFIPLQENPVVGSLLIPFSGIGAVEILKFWL